MQLKSVSKALFFAFGSFGLWAAPAYADGLSGSYTVSGGNTETFASSGSSFNSTTTGTDWVSPGVGMINFANNYPYAAVYGSGNTFALASGLGSGMLSNTGPAAGVSQIVYTKTFTNTTGSVENFNLNFHIGNGQIQLVPGLNPANISAGFNANIAVNGTTAWSTGAVLTGSTNWSNPGYTFGSTGANIGYAVTPPNSSDFSQAQETVNFGNYNGSVGVQLAPGQTDTVTYTVNTTTSLHGGSVDYYGGAYVQVGDPLSTSGNSSSFNVVAAAVPEPETYALMAAGLGVLAGVSARRKRNAA